MSISVRISEEIYEAVKRVKPVGMGIQKTIDLMLKWACEIFENINEGTENTDENFPEKMKQISESMTADFKNQNQDFENETSENDGGNSINTNLYYEKFEERFSKIENMIEKISAAVLKSENSNLDFKNKDCPQNAYANDVEASERKYNLNNLKKIVPASLPSDNDVWRAVRWKIDYENGIGVLINWGVNKLAMFDTHEKKIMITSAEMLEVWYEFNGGLIEMMSECERRVTQNFYHREPDWFLRGLQFLTAAERQALYKKQDIINNERQKKGLKKYASWRY